MVFFLPALPLPSRPRCRRDLQPQPRSRKQQKYRQKSSWRARFRIVQVSSISGSPARTSPCGRMRVLFCTAARLRSFITDLHRKRWSGIVRRAWHRQARGYSRVTALSSDRAARQRAAPARQHDVQARGLLPRRRQRARPAQADGLLRERAQQRWRRHFLTPTLLVTVERSLGIEYRLLHGWSGIVVLHHHLPCARRRHGSAVYSQAARGAHAQRYAPHGGGIASAISIGVSAWHLYSRSSANELPFSSE